MRSNHLSCNANWRLTFLKTLHNSFFFLENHYDCLQWKGTLHYKSAVQLFWGGFKVTLHGTIRNDDF